MSLSARLLMIPDWQALLLILGTIVLPSLGGFFVVERLVPMAIRRAHNDVAGFMFSAVGVMYGVLLAFVVIVVWEQFHVTRLNVQQESSVAASLNYAMGAYAHSSHSPDLQPRLLAYLHEIVDKEFPAMAVFHQPPANNRALAAIWNEVQGLSPTSPRQQVLYGELIGRLNELEQMRVKRLDDACDGLPGVIWLALIAGAVLTIGFTYLLGTENRDAHAVMFYVIIELDYPFAGTVRIGTETFRGVIAMMTEP
jgi:hypothetical protein